MKKREIKLGIPSYITVESEEGSFIGEQNSSKFEKEDICVEANENGEIWLTATAWMIKRKKNCGLDIFRLRRESMSRFFLTQQRLSRAL